MVLGAPLSGVTTLCTKLADRFGGKVKCYFLFINSWFLLKTQNPGINIRGNDCFFAIYQNDQTALLLIIKLVPFKVLDLA